MQTCGGAGSTATPGLKPWPCPALHYPRIIRCEPPTLPVRIPGDNMDGTAPWGTGARVLHPKGHLPKSVAARWVAPAPLELVQAVAFKPRGLFPGFTVKRCAIRTRACCDRHSGGAAWQSCRAAPSKTPLLPKTCPAGEAAASEVGCKDPPCFPPAAKAAPECPHPHRCPGGRLLAGMHSSSCTARHAPAVAPRGAELPKIAPQVVASQVMLAW